MPRKVGPGPAILRIEGLSTGIDPTLVDDWTGKLLAQPNARVPKFQDAQTVRDRLSRAKQNAGLELLAKVLPQVIDSPVRVGHSKPRPKHGPIITVDGKAHELVLPKRPFRRF